MSEDLGRSYDPARDASAQEPLTANEKKLVTRLFGDPFAFPMEYKAWLRGWLEEQFPRIGTLSTPADTGAAGAFVPPAGVMLDYGGDFAPGGYVMCDGAEYDKTSLVYQRLFNAIGFKFGTGSTGNMFRVPDFRERVAVMKGSIGELDTIGKNEGLGVGGRGVRHQHAQRTVGWDNVAMIPYDDGVGGPYAYAVAGTTEATPELANHHHRTGAESGPEATPAFLVVNKIISLGA